MATRFQALDWANPIVSTRIKILGLGGVGSWLSLFVNRIGVHDVVGVDNGTFESVNIANSLANTGNGGSGKAGVANMLYRSYCPRNKTATASFYNSDVTSESVRNIKSNIVVSCLDSIGTRKQEFEHFKTYVDWTKMFAFIDIRMAAEVGTIYVVNSLEDVARYEETLFTDEEAFKMPCGNKATSHCSSALSSWTTAFINNIIVNNFEGFEARRVPFKYHIDMINFINEAYD